MYETVGECVTKKIVGFEFIKAGVFYLADIPWEGRDNTGSWSIRASIKLVHKRFHQADETVYIIESDDELRYVGEYSYNFADRWLHKDYVNHHKYNEIENDLLNHKTVSIWLAISPYLRTKEIEQFNISKALEQEILRRYSPEWNKRNRINRHEQWRRRNCEKVSDIVKAVCQKYNT
jgi:hypothetical protein